MQKKHAVKALVALVLAALIAVPTALAASSAAATVTVRVEGKNKTLLVATTVHTTAGSLTRGGAGAGKCPSTSAQGALQDATHGHWVGTWSKKYGEYYVTGILGDTEATAKAYWAIYVNGVYATTGACDISLKSGDSVLFAVVPGSGKTPRALGIPTSTFTTSSTGKAISPEVVYYDAKGAAHPASGVTVAVDGKTAMTNSHGDATIKVASSGKGTITAEKPGYIRTEMAVSWS